MSGRHHRQVTERITWITIPINVVQDKEESKGEKDRRNRNPEISYGPSKLSLPPSLGVLIFGNREFLSWTFFCF